MLIGPPADIGWTTCRRRPYENREILSRQTIREGEFTLRGSEF